MRTNNVALGIICGPFICAYVIISSCFCHRNPRGGPDEDLKRFERRQRLAPRPLADRTLERSLTIAHGRELPANAQVHDQKKSRLLQLPPELRRMIYRKVLGDRRFHIVLKENKLGHLVCRIDSDLPCPPESEVRPTASCWGKSDGASIWRPMHGRRATDGDILPFLQSCRQIYSEAIDLLYSTNTFSFREMDCLRFLANTTLPSSFSQITRLEILSPMHWPIYDADIQNFFLDPPLYPPYDEATWEATWRLIAKMPNLKYLWVKLYHCHGFRDSAFEKRMLAPLRKITQVKRFEVHVSWNGDEITDAPFKLVRLQQEHAGTGWRGWHF